MTMILALNLSDQIILAADTMVTKEIESRREVVGYYPKLQPYSHKSETGFVACMYAGNLKFSRFLAKEVAGAIDNGRLSTDVNQLRAEIGEFLEEIGKTFRGKDEEKECVLIVAGTGSKNSVKPFNVSRFSDMMGPDAFRVEDEMLAQAIGNPAIPGFAEHTTWLPIRDQLVFSFKINYNKSIFGEGEAGRMHSVICAGSRSLSEKEKLIMIRHFISRRDFSKEGMDIVNFLRKNFSESIGGAVMIGVIDKRGPLVYCNYELDRSGPRHHTNWSIAPENPFIAIDPDEKRIDLMQLHWDEESNVGGMKI